MRSELHGLILTGGRSSRMGRDKAEIAYGAQPQWRAIADLIRPFCNEIYWSGTEKQINAWGIGARGLVDKIPGHGPASGLHSAFSMFPSVGWLVVACDYPFLEAQDIECLIAGRGPGVDVVTFVGENHDNIEPLLSLWEPTAQRQFLDAFGLGVDSPRRIIGGLQFRAIRPRDSRILSNFNGSENSTAPVT